MRLVFRSETVESRKPINPSMKLFIVILAIFSIAINVFLLKDFRSGDAFITMYFGLNLNEGRYLEFNMNEPSSGASSPLWMILHASMRVISVHFLDLYTHFILMKAVNVLLLILATIVLWKIMEKSGTSFVIQMIVLLSWVINPFVINWTSRCLEVPLQALTCWYAIYRILIRTEDRGKWSSFLDGAVFGLMLLTRYESGLLVCVLTAFSLGTKRWRGLYDFILLVCGFLLIYGYHLGFMLSVFGTILPTTAVKGGRLSLAGLEPIKHLLFFYGPFVVLFLLGLLTFRRMPQPKKAISLWIIGHLCFIVFILGYSHQQRYFLVVIPLMIWMALESPLISSITKYLERIQPGKVMGGACMLVLTLGAALIIYGSMENSWLHRFILLQRGDLRTRTEMAEYIKREIAPDALIAMKEVDWIPLYSKCNTLDMVGILYEDMNKHRGDIVALLKDRKPKYIILEENFIRSAGGGHSINVFKLKLLDLLRAQKQVFETDGMQFEYVHSVPYYGSGGLYELFSEVFKSAGKHSASERSKWKWYLLRVGYS
ncbi:MAG: hypothetical protein QG577_108 [Thermodesulfobacteriota bacterium]|nr:hypothetical protein [Thermodesulfobacteriota bacterium]